MKSRTITAILSFFLGSWGGQHFYLGNVGKGVLSCIFSFTMIPTIIGVIDGIKFLTMSDDEFNIKYNSADFLLSFRNSLLQNSQVLSNKSAAEELEKLANLMDRGLITFEEFEKRKKKILG